MAELNGAGAVFEDTTKTVISRRIHYRDLPNLSCAFGGTEFEMVFEKAGKTAGFYAAESNLLNDKVRANKPIRSKYQNRARLYKPGTLWYKCGTSCGYRTHLQIVESERADEEFPGENNRRSRNLRDNMLSFRKIDQNALLNSLRELGIIDEKEAVLISSQNHWKERAYYLLETILQKGNQAIDVLVQVLREQGKRDLLALLETGKNSQPSKEIFLNNSSNHWQPLHSDDGDRFMYLHYDGLEVCREAVKQPQSSNQTSCNSFNRLQSQRWDNGEITLSSRDHIPMVQIETDM